MVSKIVQKDLLGGIYKEDDIEPKITLEMFWSYKDCQAWVEDNPNHPTSKAIEKMTELDLNSILKGDSFEDWQSEWEEKKEELLNYIQKQFGWKSPSKWFTTDFSVNVKRGSSKPAERREKRKEIFAGVEEAEYNDKLKLMKAIWAKFQPREEYYSDIVNLLPRLSRRVTIDKRAIISAAKQGTKEKVGVADLLLTAEQKVLARKGKRIGVKDIRESIKEELEYRKRLKKRK